jgi:hypothetical protein
MSGSISTVVGLVVQAIDGRGQILDSVAFGTFTYWESGTWFHPVDYPVLIMLRPLSSLPLYCLQ